MKKKYKTAIIGHGIVGKRREFFLNKNRQFKITALCDKNYSNNLKKKKIIYFNNYRSLYKKFPDLDCVFICISNDMAADVTYFFLSRGVNVFCEKPPSINLQQLKKIKTIKNKNKNLRLMYGFNHRFHKSVIKAKKLIETKKYGSVLNVKATYGKSKFINFNQNDWRTKRIIAGGGILLDQGIHIVDLLLYFFGTFEEVKSLVQNNCWNFDVEDNCFALLKQKRKNIIAFIHSSASLWRHDFNIEINFKKGTVILSGILSSTKSYGNERLIILKPQKSRVYTEPKKKIYNFTIDNSWKNEIFIFGQILNRKIKEQNSIDDAIDVMKVIEKIYSNDKSWVTKVKKYNEKSIQKK
jgi:predicted dehydrogenase|tara:strand:- start:2978 stop:4036 length:1059 start_codon:yes stop_codon:yes gene_type:complete